MSITTELFAFITLPLDKKEKSRFEVPIIDDGKVVDYEVHGPAEFARIFEADLGLRFETFDALGRSMGDYWFENVDDAKNQANCMYGPYLSEWQQVPSSVSNADKFILDQLQSHKQI